MFAIYELERGRLFIFIALIVIVIILALALAHTSNRTQK
jgi:hypothetical protein